MKTGKELKTYIRMKNCMFDGQDRLIDDDSVAIDLVATLQAMFEETPFDLVATAVSKSEIDVEPAD